MKVLNQTEGNGWVLYNGDSCEVIKGIANESIGYINYSPPFLNLYVYSDTARDLGNCKDIDEFQAHFGFLISDLYRVLKPGRLMSVHCADVPLMKERDGIIGLRDFPGEIIRVMEKAGFIYHSRVTIWKSPVTEVTRTKALGLLHKQLKKDSSRCRNGLPDYIVTFRKPGDNPEPITHTAEEYPVSKWQVVAEPTWYDINQSRTLQKGDARENDQEKHICPLQLDVIDRCLELWTNQGDVVLDPFSGIGSCGYEAVKNGRRFIGIELKESYYRQACKNLARAESEARKPPQVDLFKFEKV